MRVRGLLLLGGLCSHWPRRALAISKTWSSQYRWVYPIHVAIANVDLLCVPVSEHLLHVEDTAWLVVGRELELRQWLSGPIQRRPWIKKSRWGWSTGWWPEGAPDVHRLDLLLLTAEVVFFLEAVAEVVAGCHSVDPPFGGTAPVGLPPPTSCGCIAFWISWVTSSWPSAAVVVPWQWFSQWGQAEWPETPYVTLT